LRGLQGLAGSGLTLKTFAVDQSYEKGDYVFVDGKMYVAQNNFVAKEQPQNDQNNWVVLSAPRGALSTTQLF